MADGVIIRIEGDDAPFQKTLAGIEPAVQAALRGVSASAAAVLRGISAQMEAADFAGAGSAAMDALAAALRELCRAGDVPLISRGDAQERKG